MRKILFIAILLLLLAMPTLGQGELQCEDESITAAIINTKVLLLQAQASLDSGDPEAAVTTLEEVAALTHQAVAACRGWHWEGVGNDALGPVELEAGSYLVEYEGIGGQLGGVFGITPQSLAQQEFLMPTMESPSGEFSGRFLFHVEGGRYMLSVTTANIESWTVTLTQP